ncbi:extracellular solute-binding protein [Caldibacillus lycopersici]|uniref:Extracellular solute-binding protein n=1 Tax=Perspicuibacillus lycopersici TaxID=1325689 RepID=A0AAE3LME7_9BACI|nr:extracellular solute-binding protein [Perspicuibacillus lycopersici]MCU9612642.1 extracellular solute-binding protein [Perspicuibacillus lycopersici]
MKKAKRPKVLLVFLCLLLFVPAITPKPTVLANTNDEESKNDLLENHLYSDPATENTFAKFTYQDYLDKHPTITRPDEEIVIEAADYVNGSPEPEMYENYEGMSGTSIYSSEEGSIKWEVDVPEAGYYNIEIAYFPIKGKDMNIERQLKINGEVPFDGAKYLSFSRVWANEAEIKKDENGNHRRPSQVEKPKWMTTYLKDYMGYEEEPYLFYFDKGLNTIELESVQDMMLIRTITLKQMDKIPTYEELKSSYENNNYELVKLDDNIKKQAELAELKSDAMLYPTYDRSSPATEPSDPSKIRLNTIGGETWKNVGQWLTWEIDVPENGLYEIGLKYWQNSKSGRYVSRTLLIDGEVPFKEMQNLKFPYSSDWNVMTIGDGQSPYVFYLEEGKHEITLEVSLGDLAGMISEVEDSLFQLNAAYRQMLMVIGNTPDVFRDYQLEKKMPEVLEVLNQQRTVLENVSSQLAEESGRKGITTSTLDTLVVQLGSMYEEPESIPERWAAFKTNLSSLGAWILEMQEQPLQLDYLFLSSDNVEKPKAKSGFFKNLWFSVESFFGSFVEDYSSIGESGEDALTVWVGSRDYGNILNSLAENYFEPDSGIDVNIEIVDAATLLPATLANQGPDVALQVGIGDPVNYAIRNAVVDLSQFDDFAEVADRFDPSAMVPFEFNEGYYAVPETQTFPMMFYRKDIFEELGIEAPQTWDDLYEIMPYIQKNNMNIGIPINGVTGTGSVTGIASTLSSYTMFLYQNGGTLYRENGAASALDEEEAVTEFKEWTSLYVDYSIPVLYDFANRFRTGEMPIGIADYSTYNYLSVFAPELKGLWEMVPVPGTVTNNNQINRAVSSSGTASIILKNSTHQEDAWEFIKWWTSADIQAKFGKELESIIGVAARYATANLEAVELLGWSSKTYRNIAEQWEEVVGNPEVPGGYFTPRHVENAFRKVYNDLDDPRETILDYAITIDLEINNKRIEFGLETLE